MSLGDDFFIRVIQGFGNPFHAHLLQAGKLYASQDTVLTLLEQHLRAQLHSLRMTA